MKNNSSLPRQALGSAFGYWRSCFTVFALLAFSVAGFAQEITSAIRGTVTGPNGAAVTNAAVSLVDTRTSASRSASTNASGVFSISGLRIGGPYTATITAPNFANQMVTDIYVALGDTHTFTVALSDDQIEEITVTAQQIGAVQVAIGPSTDIYASGSSRCPGH